MTKTELFGIIGKSSVASDPSPRRYVCQHISLIPSDHIAGVVSIMRLCFCSAITLPLSCGIQRGMVCARRLLARSFSLSEVSWLIYRGSQDCLPATELFWVPDLLSTARVLWLLGMLFPLPIEVYELRWMLCALNVRVKFWVLYKYIQPGEVPHVEASARGTLAVSSLSSCF